MDNNEILRTANCFHKVAYDITDLIVSNDGLSDNLDYIIPQIVNVSFACELYLKAILNFRGITYPKNAAGHSIVYLYSILTQDDKKAVQCLLPDNADISSMDNELKEIDNAFSDWRYWFEHKKHLSADILFLGNFTFAVNSVAEALIGS